MTAKTNLDDVFDAAESDAKALQETVPATQAQTQSTAVATTQSSALLDDDLFDKPTGLAGVDHWVKVKYEGIKIGDSKFIEEFECEIDTGALGRHLDVSYGNPAVYHKTYDGVNCVDNMPWTEALAKARAVNPKARPYASYDIPMYAIADIVDDKGNVLASEGELLGKSTTATETPNVQKFIDKLKRQGLFGETIKVRVGFTPRKKDGNEWGILTFTAIED